MSVIAKYGNQARSKNDVKITLLPLETTISHRYFN
jgi:hypothetical protein